MKINLGMPFVDLIIKEFGFLVTNYGYKITEVNPWRASCQKEPITIVLEFDGRSLGCWIEREDLSKADKYRALGVEVISNCLGHKPLKETLFRSKEEMLLEEAKKNSILIQKYCLKIVQGDFSDWEIATTCLKKEE